MKFGLWKVSAADQLSIGGDGAFKNGETKDVSNRKNENIGEGKFCCMGSVWYGILNVELTNWVCVHVRKVTSHQRSDVGRIVLLECFRHLTEG